MTEKSRKGPCAALDMAFVCPWSSVAEQQDSKPKEKVQRPIISFAQIVSGNVTIIDEQLPAPIIKG